MKINGKLHKRVKEKNECNAKLALWMRHAIKWLVDKI